MRSPQGGCQLVFVTKYRHKILTAESLTLIKKTFQDVAKKMDFQLLEFNGESDPIHILVKSPPKLSISLIVNTLKGVSSRKYGQAGFIKPDRKTSLWSPSYFVSSLGSVPPEVLKSYIKNQEKPSQKNGVLNPFF